MDELPGDDIFGLQSALFKAGVASVLGSLWIVEEQSSSAILRSVHRHLADGVDSPEALRRAVKEYLSGAPARANGVYFWAPWFISSLANTRKGA